MPVSERSKPPADRLNWTTGQSAGVVGTIVGDYVAQKLTHRTEIQAASLRGEAVPEFTFDIMRASRLVMYGALVGTPLAHGWFQLLDTVRDSSQVCKYTLFKFVGINVYGIHYDIMAWINCELSRIGRPETEV